LVEKKPGDPGYWPLPQYVPPPPKPKQKKPGEPGYVPQPEYVPPPPSPEVGEEGYVPARGEYSEELLAEHPGAAQMYRGEEAIKRGKELEYQYMSQRVTGALAGKPPGIYQIPGTDYYAIVGTTGTVKILSKGKFERYEAGGWTLKEALELDLISPVEYRTGFLMEPMVSGAVWGKYAKFEELWTKDPFGALKFGLAEGLISPTQYGLELEALERHQTLSGLIVDINKLIERANKLSMDIYEARLGIYELRKDILGTLALEPWTPKTVTETFHEFFYGGGLERELWAIAHAPLYGYEEAKKKYKAPTYVGGPVGDPFAGVTGTAWLTEGTIGRIEADVFGKPSPRSKLATWQELGISYAIIGGTVVGVYVAQKYGPRVWTWAKTKVTRKLFPEQYYFERYIGVAPKVEEVDTGFRVLTKTGKAGWTYSELSVTEKPIVETKWSPTLWEKPKGFKPTIYGWGPSEVLPSKAGMALYAQTVTKTVTETVAKQTPSLAKIVAPMSITAIKPKLEEKVKLEELEVSIPYLVKSTLGQPPSKYAMKPLPKLEMPAYPTLKLDLPMHPLEKQKRRELEETLAMLKLDQFQLSKLREAQTQTSRQLSKMDQTVKQLPKEIQLPRQFQPQLPKEIQLPKQWQPQLPKEWIEQIPKQIPKPPPFLFKFDWPREMRLPRGKGFWGGWFKRVHAIAEPREVMRALGIAPTRRVVKKVHRKTRGRRH